MKRIATLDKPARIPAPVGGMNSVSPGTELPESDCIYAYNMVAADMGLVVRTGWREWAINLTGAVDSTIRTTMSFHGSIGSADKLFAVTSTGIWDVTSSGSSPTQALAFAISGGNAGWGVAAAVVTAGGHFLLYADEVNGLHYYSESTGIWAAYTSGSGTGQVSGVDPTTIVSVTVWKNRVWLTQRDRASAWYLAVGAVFGAATEFSFGQRFAHGGYLVGLYNWSTDGGSGLDTLLVAIGAGGDVAIYVGTDPSSANTFGLKGVWFVGSVPAGRTIATDYGGDLLILSSLGVMPLSRLIIGNPSVDRTQYATSKISNLFSSLVSAGRNLRGWSIHTHPSDSAVLVFVPVPGSTATIQLAMSTTSRGWTRYRDIPMVSAAVWEGELYFGTDDGRVCRNVGVVDEVTLADPSSGDPIQWSILTRYQGSPSNVQVQAIRPILLSKETGPVYQATARYDFDTAEPDAPTGTSSGGPGTWSYGAVTCQVTATTLWPASAIGVTFSEPAVVSTGTFLVISPEIVEVNSYVAITATTGTVNLSDPTAFDHAAGTAVLGAFTPSGPATLWNVALWGGGHQPAIRWRGATGAGKDFAVALRGASVSRTVLVGIDVAYQTGGLL